MTKYYETKPEVKRDRVSRLDSALNKLTGGETERKVNTLLPGSEIDEKMV